MLGEKKPMETRQKKADEKVASKGHCHRKGGEETKNKSKSTRNRNTNESTNTRNKQKATNHIIRSAAGYPRSSEVQPGQEDKVKKTNPTHSERKTQKGERGTTIK